MRNCPVCGSSDREVVYGYRLTSGVEQLVYVCLCGMVYASCHVADYSDSIYSLPGALGSGSSPYDKERLKGVAERILQSGVPRGARIVDIGCAQGGLLEALWRAGFTSLMGVDPSKPCVDAVKSMGFKAVQSSLESELPKADLYVLSHVLEHVEDPGSAILHLAERLSEGGSIYIEVPDAERYHRFNIPFLDFNSEHINHFSMSHLVRIIEGQGMSVTHSGTRTITLTNGALYPVIWLVATPSPEDAILAYIDDSVHSMEKLNENLERELGEECVIWGAGEYMAHIASLPVFKRVKIVQAVDRNPSLHGKTACGVLVESPLYIRRDLPIVIAAIVAEKSIRESIEEMGLTNKVVTLR